MQLHKKMKIINKLKKKNLKIQFKLSLNKFINYEKKNLI